ncbi:tetratricopeptide repeat protein [Ekhidna sp.]
MKTIYNYELIEDYLDGILDSQTMNELRHLLATDESAREIAKGILIMKNHFKNDQEIESYLDEILSRRQKVINKHVRKKKLGLLHIAASLTAFVLLSLAVYQFSKPSIEGILNNHLSDQYKISTTLRNSNYTNHFDKTLSAYRSKNYQEVIERLNNPHTAKEVFLKGLSFLYSGEYQLAIKEFERESLINSRFEEQARWYLSVAYLKVREWDKAKKVLLVIVEFPSHYKKKESQKLLNFINDRE